jgi:hypothetical protein
MLEASDHPSLGLLAWIAAQGMIYLFLELFSHSFMPSELPHYPDHVLVTRT